MSDLIISDEVRADVEVIQNLNGDRVALETWLEQFEAGSYEFDEITDELEVIQQALASAAVDVLESLTGQR